MPTIQACWRSLAKYKYQLMDDYERSTSFELPVNVDMGFVRMTESGVLTILNRYAWDGPSGITIDTKSFMRGSLVHDALYQLMREEKFDYQKDREKADDLLRKICLEDGMSKFRAWYVYRAVRAFGESHARPANDQKNEVTCVPGNSD